MNFLRFAFVSSAVVFVTQIGFTDGFIPALNFVDGLPVLSFLKTLPIQNLFNCVNVTSFPLIESQLRSYAAIDPEDICCHPSQFPQVFRFMYNFFACFQALGKELGRLLCDLIKAITPLNCTGRGGVGEIAGCILKALLGPIFGEVGTLVGTISGRLLSPLDKFNGCFLSGVVQDISYVWREKPDLRFGDAVGPTAVLSTILGTILSLVYCLGQPITVFTEKAYDAVTAEIIKQCQLEKLSGLWVPQS